MFKTLKATACCSIFLAVLGVAGTASANGSITLITSGVTTPNVQPAPTLPAFGAWCADKCHPTTQFPLYNPDTGVFKGYGYVWASPFSVSADGKSFCFEEFIEYTLPGGTIYSKSNHNGTCGAVISPALKPATHLPALFGSAYAGSVVVGGGGDGVIVAGTGGYSNLKGIQSDRLFVELDFVPGHDFYYDNLFFTITPQ